MLQPLTFAGPAAMPWGGIRNERDCHCSSNVGLTWPSCVRGAKRVMCERGREGRGGPALLQGAFVRGRRFVAQARPPRDSDSRDYEARARPQCSLPRPTVVQPRHVAPSASEAYPAFQGAHERSVLILHSCGGLGRSHINQLARWHGYRRSRPCPNRSPGLWRRHRW